MSDAVTGSHETADDSGAWTLSDRPQVHRVEFPLGTFQIWEHMNNMANQELSWPYRANLRTNLGHISHQNLNKS